MRRLAAMVALSVIFVAFAARAQTLPPQALPPGVNPETGARPGNEIGTGASLPLSDTAGGIASQNPTSDIAPNLPSPPIGEDATPHDYLKAARSALLVGRTGEAQQALEMAETRALDRSVPLFKTGDPSQDPLVGQIQQALQALGAGDRAKCVQIIEAALAQTG
jgi:hypothetical protein